MTKYSRLALIAASLFLAGGIATAQAEGSTKAAAGTSAPYSNDANAIGKPMNPDGTPIDPMATGTTAPNRMAPKAMNGSQSTQTGSSMNAGGTTGMSNSSTN